MKRALIILASIAVLLGIVTFFVVFYSGGNYVVSSPLPSSTSFVSSTATLASSTSSSTASSTLGLNSSSTSSSTDFQEFESSYTTPPITWMEGYDTLAITGATLSGSQLTLEITISMGDVAECVPTNLRLVTDEKGDLAAPLTTSFSFPDSGNCEGAPGVTYADQEVVFTVDPNALPLLLTTGGSSNKYFEISTDSSGGVDIAPPPTNG